MNLGEQTGYNYKTGTAMTAPVDGSSLPSDTSRHRYISGTGSSLAYNRQIEIDTSPPTVIKVFPTLHQVGTAKVQTNPGTFGVGEEVFLSVDFTHNVTVNYTALMGGVGGPPYLLLETGETVLHLPRSLLVVP